MDYLATIKSSARSLLGILNDVLDFSKIEAGRLEIVPQPFRVADPVRDACATLMASAQEKGIGLSWRIAPEVPEWAQGDDSRIRQILLNLVGNAIKFTAQGEVSVSVGALLGNDSEMQLLFAVKDTGAGIPPEHQKTIFEPFRQGDGSTSRKYGGTGLGLSICSKLIALMGGEIRVESELGVGSIFRFWVCARQVQPPSDLPAELPAAPGSQRALIARRGHTVVLVENGKLAVERSAAETFDLILMDVQMPEMDGWEATRSIRERERSTGILVKPFEPAALYAAIEEAGNVPCGRIH
jgi:hypothetical protein